MNRRAAVLLAVGLSLPGCGADSVPRPGERLYQGRSAALPVSVVYPARWRLTEEAGVHEGYEQIRLQGPRNQEDTYTAYITVRGRLLPEADRTDAALDAWIRGYVSGALEGSGTESDTELLLADAPARDLVSSITVPPLFRQGLQPLEIPITTRMVVCRRGAYLYELVYSADSREYDRHAPVFARLLTSVRFH
jgi:hypothetical protein